MSHIRHVVLVIFFSDCGGHGTNGSLEYVCGRSCRDRKQYVMQREVSEQVSDLHRILERSEPTKRR